MNPLSPPWTYASVLNTTYIYMEHICIPPTCPQHGSVYSSLSRLFLLWKVLNRLRQRLNLCILSYCSSGNPPLSSKYIFRNCKIFQSVELTSTSDSQAGGRRREETRRHKLEEWKEPLIAPPPKTHSEPAVNSAFVRVINWQLILLIM